MIVFKNFPPEILNAIIEQLPPAELRANGSSLLRISKDWYSAAIRKALQHISLDGQTIQRFPIWSTTYTNHVQQYTRVLDLSLRGYLAIFDDSSDNMIKDFERRLGRSARADDVEIGKARRTWYQSLEDSLTSFQSVVSSCKQLQVFCFEVWQERQMDSPWWRSQLLKAQVVSTLVKSVPVSNLKMAKIDIMAELQDFESSPHRCACDIVIELLPYIKELQMRANPICPHFLQRSLERHPAPWPLEKLYINVSSLEDPETAGQLQLMIRRDIYICKAYIPAGQRIPGESIQGGVRVRHTSRQKSIIEQLASEVQAVLPQIPRLKLARAINRAGKVCIVEDLMTREKKTGSFHDWTLVGGRSRAKRRLKRQRSSGVNINQFQKGYHSWNTSQLPLEAKKS